MSGLKDKVLFITGASRGIGLAIARRAAGDGARVTIAAKTTAAHPKLPGTIYTAAREVEAAGGECLPLAVDIRHDDEVAMAVERTVREFGGIDILINNASAISLTRTPDTPMKRYDLMNAVNARGTFLCSQACLPHLKESANPHILVMSPPLNMKAKWFAPHVGYTIAKYGMSMCVLGMAEEFRGEGIAVNALWPRTVIATAALQMNPYVEVKRCRKPEIMADAAYLILTRPSRELTGQFLVDEDVLRQTGVNDFTQYAVQPGEPLHQDYFLD
jgi:citronellol/citronellal dehydrogenase